MGNNMNENKDRHIDIKLSFTEIAVDIKHLGSDISILVYGGDKAHIGCTVISQPRMSLTGDGTVSVTSSVMNILGHKDEFICRLLAERCAKVNNCICTCTGGVHIDNASKEQIEEIVSAIEKVEV